MIRPPSGGFLMPKEKPRRALLFINIGDGENDQYAHFRLDRMVVPLGCEH